MSPDGASREKRRAQIRQITRAIAALWLAAAALSCGGPVESIEEIPSGSSSSTGEGSGGSPCQNVRCSGHGACVEESGRPTCLCEQGFVAAGTECTSAAAAPAERDPPTPTADPCAGVTCVPHAHCAAGQCVCDSGFEGDPPNECKPVPSVEDQKRAKLIAAARAELGKCEGTSDEPYMNPAGNWCVAFVQWVYKQITPTVRMSAGKTCNIADVPAGCKPEPGDTIRFNVNSHHGLVLSVSPDYQQITTIEGNYGRCVKSRTVKLSAIKYFLLMESVLAKP